MEEVRGQQHWWWDTKDANDGGVVNDAVLRRVYSGNLPRLSVAASLARAQSISDVVVHVNVDGVAARPGCGSGKRVVVARFVSTSSNPASFGSRHGILILQVGPH